MTELAIIRIVSKHIFFLFHESRSVTQKSITSKPLPFLLLFNQKERGVKCFVLFFYIALKLRRFGLFPVKSE